MVYEGEGRVRARRIREAAAKEGGTYGGYAPLLAKPWPPLFEQPSAVHMERSLFLSLARPSFPTDTEASSFLWWAGALVRFWGGSEWGLATEPRGLSLLPPAVVPVHAIAPGTENSFQPAREG